MNRQLLQATIRRKSGEPQFGCCKELNDAELLLGPFVRMRHYDAAKTVAAGCAAAEDSCLTLSLSSALCSEPMLTAACAVLDSPSERRPAC